jgi:hypothetical protein
MAAAERGLNLAAQDKGLVETIWLLTQLPLAARADDFAGELRRAGLDVSDSPTVMEIVGAFADAVDARLANNGGRTDLGEMAQMAAARPVRRPGAPAGAGAPRPDVRLPGERSRTVTS